MSRFNRIFNEWSAAALDRRRSMVDLGTGHVFGSNQARQYGVLGGASAADSKAVQYLTIDVRPEPRPDMVANASALPLADGTVAIFFCESILNHVVPVDAVPKIVSEMHRALIDGGLLVGWVPFCFHTTSHPREFYDTNRFTYDGISHLLRHFPDVEIQACGGPMSVLLDACLRPGYWLRQRIEPLETRLRYSLLGDRQHERFLNSTGFRFMARKGQP